MTGVLPTATVLYVDMLPSAIPSPATVIQLHLLILDRDETHSAAGKEFGDEASWCIRRDTEPGTAPRTGFHATSVQRGQGIRQTATWTCEADTREHSSLSSPREQPSVRISKCQR